jgi:hypothetical protein
LACLKTGFTVSAKRFGGVSNGPTAKAGIVMPMQAAMVSAKLIQILLFPEDAKRGRVMTSVALTANR